MLEQRDAATGDCALGPMVVTLESLGPYKQLELRLDNVVLLLAPSLNPDGQIMITDYYRKFLGTATAAASLTVIPVELRAAASMAATSPVGNQPASPSTDTSGEASDLKYFSMTQGPRTTRLPAGPVQSIDQALTSAHTVHRGDVIGTDWYRGVASPIRFVTM